MTGLCEGGNEPPGSLKAICFDLFMGHLQNWSLLVLAPLILFDSIPFHRNTPSQETEQVAPRPTTTSSEDDP
ncbi:hypothetical protein ANN_23179 [Periplaneta americana]|uniref:Uncharacterized protein n=1 Tax=Periplaneta americana TaxID=6978 RepID=A0ABQ8SLV4_PERAM|nr:hypothetical protein ANN_23179 [Periplaneta americana]